MLLSPLLSWRLGPNDERLEDVLLMQTMAPRDKRAWVRARQIEAFKQILGRVPAANIFNGLIVLAVCWDTPLRHEVLLWLTAVTMLSSVPVLRTLGRGAGRTSDFRSLKSIWRAARDAFFMALLWAALPVIVFKHPDPSVHTIVAVVTAGMMCGGCFMLATMAPVALVFAGTICAGGVIALLSNPAPDHVYLCLLLLSYVLVLAACVTWTQHLFISQLMAKASADEKTQVIGLLLNEFEQGAADWLWQTDREGRIVDPSARFADALNIDLAELAGWRLLALANPGPERDTLTRLMTAQSAFRDLELPVSAADGQRWLALSGQPIIERDVFCGFRGVASDITASRQASRHIAYLAHNDSLTGLPNRLSLRQCFERLIKETPSGARLASALLILDVDQFKWVNDTLGHPGGDALLRRLSTRLTASVPDAMLISRLGGDEFAILLADDLTPDDVRAQVDAITAIMASPFAIMETTVQSGVSIGVRLITPEDRDPDVLLRHADLALYRAKADGRGRACYFVADMEAAAQERRLIEADLRLAIERGEFHLALQPLWDIQTGGMIGFEALVRWQHPERGLLAPAAFIAIAEQCGLIEPIGNWVLRAALEAARELPDTVTVAVNISPTQLVNPSFAGMVINALATTGVAAHRLELEITESALFDGSESNLMALRQVAQMGVHIALDDFGTGYSSLSHLQMFPFNKIKIDRSFVAQVVEREDCRAIIRAVCAMARSMNMVTTAEGVETEEQLALIRAVGCHQVQGYLLSRPVSLDSLKATLAGPTPIAFVNAA